MNTNESKTCPICEYERQLPKHMLERALYRALPQELQSRIRGEREASMRTRRLQARAKFEKWSIDNPLAETPTALRKETDSLNAARKEYNELKRIHEAGECVERKKVT